MAWLMVCDILLSMVVTRSPKSNLDEKIQTKQQQREKSVFSELRMFLKLLEAEKVLCVATNISLVSPSLLG